VSGTEGRDADVGAGGGGGFGDVIQRDVGTVLSCVRLPHEALVLSKMMTIQIPPRQDDALLRNMILLSSA
jgi:hypothetical protein